MSLSSLTWTGNSQAYATAKRGNAGRSACVDGFTRSDPLVVGEVVR